MMQPFHYDTAMTLALYLTGSLAVYLAYRFGSRTWRTRFAISVHKQAGQRRVKEGPRKVVPGQIGEMVNLTLIYALLLATNRLTPDIYIHNLLRTHTLFVAGAFVVVVCGVIFYVCHTCRSIRAEREQKRNGQEQGSSQEANQTIKQAAAQTKDQTARQTAEQPQIQRLEQKGAATRDIYCLRLRRGYAPYTLYGVAVYTAIAVLVTLIIGQFAAEVSRFLAYDEEVRGLIDLFRQLAMPTPEQADSFVEALYGRTLLGSTYIINQISTVLLITAACFTIHFVAAYTPVGDIFEKKAIVVLQGIFIFSVALVAMVAWYLYFNSYIVFYERTIQAVKDLRDLVETGTGETISRYNATLLDLVRRQGVTGFLVTLANECGGGVIALGTIQVLWGRRGDFRKKKDKAKTPAVYDGWRLVINSSPTPTEKGPWL